MTKIPTNYPNIFTYSTTKGKRYYIRRSFMINGRKQEVTKSGLKTLAEARSALAEIENKIDQGDYHISKNLTVDQFWEKYYDKKTRTGQWAPDTEANKVSIYTNHFLPKYGHVKLKDLNREDYELFINGMLKTHSKHSVRQAHGIFMAILNDAVACGNLTQNTLQKIYIGESHILPQNRKLKLADFKIIDQTARNLFGDYEYTIFRSTYFGLRKSEVAGIQLKTPVERSDGRLELHLTASRTNRRDGRNKQGLEQMKTKDSRRVVVLDQKTSNLFRTAIQTSRHLAKEQGRILNPDDYLFLAHYPNAHRRGFPIPISRVEDLFHQVEKACGIYVRPHMMRHFFASQAVASGIPIEHMAAALGHSTSYMTEKYTHIQEEISASVTDNFLKVIQ
ncbi:integrase [Streptococcus phage Javan173]|uniref:tyrosine-type recombinase/integrase n=1 Tax=Streptococcus entericus TaxID=155680 RepID=UPI00036F82CB|nr:tyrosine-type recombinase/integrase [Streptococcus entericus]QBX15186.1 integrase [Streptococcus phage Javan173]